MIGVNAILLYLFVQKWNKPYLWLKDNVGWKFLIKLLACEFCMAGWMCIIEWVIFGWGIEKFFTNWALTVVIYNLL